MEKEVKIIAFYLFNELTNIESLKKVLFSICETNGIRGTILLAPEGINGTVAGSAAGISALTDFFQAYKPLEKLTWKVSYADFIPFEKLKVRLKKVIVKLGVADIDPTKVVGEYVEPEDWNALISQPETLTIDTRNDYEYAIGTFKGSVNPNTHSFCEFPEYFEQHLDKLDRNTKIAMFCTGGIRCEKSTSYLKEQGFKHIYHLNGGILNYLEKIAREDSLWEGECFVFDDRVTVNHELAQGTHTLCADCDAILSPEDRESPYYEEGVCCSQCYTKHYGEQAVG